MTAALTREELLALPAVTDLETAGRAYGLGRTTSQQLARNGKFPVPVLRLGTQWRVPTAPLLRALGLDPLTGESLVDPSRTTPDMSESAAPG
jgi:hypothetical protein